VVTIGVVGLGVVGGTVAEAFASAGVPTIGYDSYQGIGSPADLSACDVVFLCVPTPVGVDGGHDLAEVRAAMDRLVPHLRRGVVVALKSTVPPGTSDELAAAYPKLEFANVPEFLVATQPVETFTRPDRIVIGARSGEAATILADLMTRVAPAAPVIVVTPTEAELVKLCANAMLSAKVTMANELSEITRRYGVAWTRVQSVIGLDHRIGPDHLTVTPERGFGGACLPKDLAGLIAAAIDAGYRPQILEAIRAYNDEVRREAAGVTGDPALGQPATV
jgi:UDPglucose 6-dehydrogenase